MSAVLTLNVQDLPYDRSEILRYCGAKKGTRQITDLMEDCITEMTGKVSNRICFAEFGIEDCGGYFDLQFAKTDSSLVKKHLKNCKSVILFGATIGIEIDRLIGKYGVISPSRALMLQSIGAERIEALCNYFENKIKEQYKAEGKNVTSRISAGYGDFPIEMQKPIFSVLDCPRKIGLSLNESMLMSPSKSVTAIMGVQEK